MHREIRKTYRELLSVIQLNKYTLVNICQLQIEVKSSTVSILKNVQSISKSQTWRLA